MTLIAPFGLNSAFSAFPDTSLFAEGHISYSFKIRAPADEETSESAGSYFSTPEDPKPSTVSTPLKSPSPNRDSGFFGPVTEAAETPLSEKALPTKGETAVEYRKWDERGRKWLYGYVWFQQRKDKSIVRGYMQVRICCWHWIRYEADPELRTAREVSSYCHIMPTRHCSRPFWKRWLLYTFRTGILLWKQRVTG